MIILDCESRESALASAASIYGVKASDIEEFLRSFDIDAHYSKHNPHRPADEELRALFEEAMGCVAAPIDRVCWFHLTRTGAASDFSNGIQPLSEMIDCIWESILKVFRATKHESPLIELRREGVPDSRYREKAHDPLHAGPYAMLVREAAMHSHLMHNHDYLWLPEIMEDICNGYQKAYGESIHDELNRALVPKIVKFWSSHHRSEHYIEVAMYYLYLMVHNGEMSGSANTCYDGNNVAIPPERILNVEDAKDYKGRFVPIQTPMPAAARVTFTHGDGGIVIHFDGTDE